MLSKIFSLFLFLLFFSCQKAPCPNGFLKKGKEEFLFCESKLPISKEKYNEVFFITKKKGPVEYLGFPLALPATNPGTLVEIDHYRLDTDFKTKLLKDAGSIKSKVVHVRHMSQKDINKDNNPDLLIVDHGTDTDPFPGGINRLFLSHEEGYKEIILNKNDLMYSFFSGISDYNKDGKEDLFIQNPTGKFPLGFYSQDNQLKWTFSSEAFPNSLTQFEHSYLASLFEDIDHDGDEDLILGGHDRKDQPFDIFLLNNNGKFIWSPSQVFPKRKENQNWGTVDIKKFNSNSFIHVTHDDKFTKGSFQIFQISKDLKIKELDLDLKLKGENFWIPWANIIDLDQNGLDDIVLTYRATKMPFKLPYNLSILMNPGTKSFKHIHLPPHFDVFNGVHFGDFNDDQKPDILLHHFSGKLSLLFNRF